MKQSDWYQKAKKEHDALKELWERLGKPGEDFYFWLLSQSEVSNRGLHGKRLHQSAL